MAVRGGPVRAVDVYARTVALAGLGVLAVVLARTDLSQLAEGHLLVLTLLVGALVVGELRPVPIARGDGTSAVVTSSTSFAIALVVLGPLAVVLLGQAVAVLLEDRRQGRRAEHIAFNIGQYVIALVAARGVYSLVTGADLLGGYAAMDGAAAVGALLAGAVLVVLNEVLVAGAVALSERTSLRAVLLDGWVLRLETSALLVSLGVVAAAVVEVSPWLLPLVAAPVVAVWRITELAAAREHAALHDRTTGLGNREMLRVRTDLALRREEGPPPAVLVLDLDGFREVNDALGHVVGDQVLSDVARRLEIVAPRRATVARLGADEFAVLLPAATARDVEVLADHVLAALVRPLQVVGTRIAVRGCVGGVLATPDVTDGHRLLQRADIALHRAKREGGGFRLYDPASEQPSSDRLALVLDLQEAMGTDQLAVLFQPQVDAGSGHVVGVEALVRWRHPRRGLLGPDEFVDLAENAGLGGALVGTVLDGALAAAAHWRDHGWDVTVAVNLSARQLGDLTLPDQVRRRLERWAVPAGLLTLEVTESGVLGDATLAAQVLDELRRTGVRLAIDDFGTGHSSLVRLQRLAVDELKIDRSFVTAVALNPQDEILVRNVVDLAHALRLTVVAEGVETAEAATVLRGLGVDRLQGYLVGRPLEREALDRVLEAQAAAIAAEERARVLRVMPGRRPAEG